MIFFKKTMLLSILATFSTFSQAEVESWYSFWSVGFASHSYPEELQKELDELPVGITHTQVALDMLGFYWPFPNDQSILGVVINGSGDSFTDGFSTFQLSQSSLAISAMHFFGSEPGDGFFIRGDVGSSSLSVSLDGYNYGASESGLGLLGGIGYGIKMSEETRILLGVSYARNAIPYVTNDNYATNETFDSLRFTISGLW